MNDVRLNDSITRSGTSNFLAVLVKGLEKMYVLLKLHYRSVSVVNRLAARSVYCYNAQLSDRDIHCVSKKNCTPKEVRDECPNQ